MPTDQASVTHSYVCPLVAKSVIVTGVAVSLDRQGRVPVAFEPLASGCSGMPACGCVIGTDPCPYPG